MKPRSLVPAPHILIFTDTFYETNGVGSYYRTLLHWCRGRTDVAVTVVCPARDHGGSDHTAAGDWSDESAILPIRPSVGMRNPFYPDLTLGYYAPTIIRRLVSRQKGPLVFHVATSGPLGCSAGRVARGMGLPMVGCYHTNMHFYAQMYGRRVVGGPGVWLGGRLAGFCDSLAYRNANLIYAPSSAAAISVRSFYRGPIHIIPNPLDLDRFYPAPTRHGRFRDRFGREGQVLVIAVGRVAQEKNLDLLCRQLGGDPRIRLVVVGDGPYADELRRRWGVRITGFLHGHELIEAYQQADLFVQLSRSETFGLSLVEALACGLPAIVVRAPGFAESLPPHHGVLVLEESEIPNLAEHCVKVVGDPGRYARQRRLSRGLVRELDPDLVFPKVVDLHRSLLVYHRAGERGDEGAALPVGTADHLRRGTVKRSWARRLERGASSDSAPEPAASIPGP